MHCSNCAILETERDELRAELAALRSRLAVSVAAPAPPSFLTFDVDGSPPLAGTERQAFDQAATAYYVWTDDERAWFEAGWRSGRDYAGTVPQLRQAATARDLAAAAVTLGRVAHRLRSRARQLGGA